MKTGEKKNKKMIGRALTTKRQKMHFAHGNRGARWFIFKPKIPIWVNFGWPKIGKCCYILWTFEIFYVFRFWYHAPRKLWQPCTERGFLIPPSSTATVAVSP
jgi:hypothetical protein